MKKLVLLTFLFIGGSVFFYWRSANINASAKVSDSSVLAEVQKEDKKNNLNEDYKEYIVKDGDTFATILEQFSIDYLGMQEILEASVDTYDFTKVRIDRPFYFVYVNGIFDRFEYERDIEEKIIVKKDVGGYKVYTENIQYEVEEVVVEANINSSLFLAGLDAGVEESTVLELAEIFAWSVDFATAIRQGDSFKLLYEKRTRDGKEAPAGRILAARFINDGEEFTAFRYEKEDGDISYFNREGESLVRQFLKAPLTFSRITSGFTYNRFHPTLGKNTPHRAIDYAAPVGTPIHATADGTIVYAGWNGGNGNYIDIHHNDVYSTQYAHLSAYAKGIKKGVKVKQGDVIGYVGSTGYSTGPHLHYQIKKNGELVNPLTIELPAGDPVPESEKNRFNAVRDELNQKLKI